MLIKRGISYGQGLRTYGVRFYLLQMIGQKVTSLVDSRRGPTAEDDGISLAGRPIPEHNFVTLLWTSAS